MRLVTSNRAEALVEQLCRALTVAPAGPFEPEYVLVHSSGMEAWLSQRIASRVGVSANVRFPYPAHVLPELFERVLGGVASGASAWTQSAIMWAIVAELPARLGRTEYAEVASYVGARGGGAAGAEAVAVATGLGAAHGSASALDVDVVRLMQLADRLARAFAGYLYYRPEMVARWQSDAPSPRTSMEAWQCDLWRAVRARLGAPNVVELFAAFRNALVSRGARGPQLSLDLGARTGAPVDETTALPRRLFVFGVSTLPRLQLEILASLSRVIDVELYVLSPSREFFADIESAKAVARRERRTALTAAEAYLEVGNPLLASWGKLGRDFQHAMLEADLLATASESLFEDPLDAGLTALRVLQSDVLHLRHRGVGASTGDDPRRPPRQLLHEADRSVNVHACHGPMRQVEVLHDVLLDRFDGDATLSPSDVVVMCADLETYGPLIEAVFDRSGDGRRIPFRVADRRLRRESPVAEAFLALLALADSRVTASAVMDVVSLAPVHERFGIAADDLSRLARWVEQAGIRWGIDAEHRASHGQPPYDDNTWRFGLERALLGVAVVDDGTRMFGGRTPYDAIEGSDAVLLGRFVALCDGLFGWCRALAVPRGLAGWRDALGDALGAMVAATNDTAWEHEQIRRLLDGAAAEGERVDAGGASLSFPLVAMRGLLESALTESRSPHGFLTGAVTFCEAMPMRSIPFRVVVLLGMDERAFPRSGSRHGFDLMAQEPRVGDRSLRDDDRYLFLEALLAARDALIVTYTGQSVRDNAPLPPSVVVSELLDACAESFDVSGGDAAVTASRADERVDRVLARLVTPHPLQPFSERYFTGDESRLFTYASEYMAGAASLLAGARERPRFVTRRASPAEQPFVALDALVRFFRRPMQTYFTTTLNVRFGDEDEPLRDREPIVLSRLEAARHAASMLNRNLRGQSAHAAHEQSKSRGELPLGVAGELQFEQAWGRSSALAAEVKQFQGDTDAARVEVHVEVDGVVVGGLVPVYGDRLVDHRYGSVEADHELETWVRFVALRAAGIRVTEAVRVGLPSRYSEAVRRGSSRGGQVSVVRWWAPEDATAVLRELVALYRLGLSQPPLLFPRTSYAWWCAEHARKDVRGREEAAGRVWRPWGESFAEGHDRYARCVLGDGAPWDGDAMRRALGPLYTDGATFAQLAARVFEPLEAAKR